MYTQERIEKRRKCLRSGYKARKKLLKSSIQAKLRYDLSDENKRRFYLSEDWQFIKQWAFRVFQRVCFCCGSTDDLHLDHIIPVSISPEKCLDDRNVQYLCKYCNELKSNMGKRRFSRKFKSNIVGCRRWSTKEDSSRHKSKWVKYFPLLVKESEKKEPSLIEKEFKPRTILRKKELK